MFNEKKNFYSNFHSINFNLESFLDFVILSGKTEVQNSHPHERTKKIFGAPLYDVKSQSILVSSRKIPIQMNVCNF
jgi:hypothetical protein